MSGTTTGAPSGRRPQRACRGRGVAAAVLAILIGVGSWSVEAAQPQQIVGHAHVLDGDTIEIAGTRIRLHGTIISCIGDFVRLNA